MRLTKVLCCTLCACLLLTACGSTALQTTEPQATEPQAAESGGSFPYPGSGQHDGTGILWLNTGRAEDAVHCLGIVFFQSQCYGP